jgi:hypothetical protein
MAIAECFPIAAAASYKKPGKFALRIHDGFPTIDGIACRGSRTAPGTTTTKSATRCSSDAPKRSPSWALQRLSAA